MTLQLWSSFLCSVVKEQDFSCTAVVNGLPKCNLVCCVKG